MATPSAMMVFRIGASSLSAQERAIEVISNNIANVNTHGFDRGRVEFQELLAGQSSDQEATGVAVAAVRTMLRQGVVRGTGRSLDLAIQGEGYFQVSLPDGTTGYTRNGSFQRGPGGRITTTDGYGLTPDLTIPPEAQDFAIGSDGLLTIRTAGSTEWVVVGGVQVARFPNPESLNHVGHGVYVPSDATGPVQAAPPAEGQLVPAALEESTVEVGEEMTDLIVAQRIYSLGVKVVQTADEMQRLANQLLG